MVKHAPIIFQILFILLTYLIFEFGPWAWPVYDYGPVRLYVCCCFLVIIIGYFFGYNSEVFKKNDVSPSNIANVRGLFFIYLIGLLSVVIASYARTGEMVPNILYGLYNPGKAYSEYVERSFTRGYWTYLEYINIFISFFFYATIVSVFIYWKSITVLLRALGVFSIIYYFLLYLAIGVSKGVLAILVPLPLTVFFVYLGQEKIKISVKSLFFVLLFTFLLVGAFLTFFTYVQAGRGGGVAVSGNFGPPIYITASRSETLPVPLSIAYESLSRYLAQGYYALTLVLDLDSYNCGYGVASSMFMMRQFEPFLGESWINGTALFVVEKKYDWGVYTLWSSLPSWLINGFGIIGSLFYLLALGVLYGRCWRKVLCVCNINNLTLFFFLNVTFLFFSANNQIFQNADTTFSFLMAVIIFVFIERRCIAGQSHEKA